MTKQVLVKNAQERWRSTIFSTNIEHHTIEGDSILVEGKFDARFLILPYGGSCRWVFTLGPKIRIERMEFKSFGDSWTAVMPEAIKAVNQD